MQALDKWEQDHQHQLPEKKEPPPEAPSEGKVNSRRGKRLQKDPSKSSAAPVKETRKGKEAKPPSAQTKPTK